jgi:pyruvate,orthophosphate dikinase
MGELNVNVRLLDPPLHEFLPQEDDQIEELAKELNKTPEEIKARIDDLHEFNPMMGHRGCRLDVSYPEIGRMQTPPSSKPLSKFKRIPARRLLPKS